MEAARVSAAMCGDYCYLAKLTFDEWRRAAELWEMVQPSDRRTIHSLAIAAAGVCPPIACTPGPSGVTVVPIPPGGGTVPAIPGASPPALPAPAAAGAAGELQKIICTPEKLASYNMALGVIQWLHAQTVSENLRTYLIALALFLNAVIAWCNAADDAARVALLKDACAAAKVAILSLNDVSLIMKLDLALLDVFEVGPLVDEFSDLC